MAQTDDVLFDTIPCQSGHLGCLFGFFMAWGVGANDVANAMATSVGSKALTIRKSLIIAAIFETIGALFTAC